MYVAISNWNEKCDQYLQLWLVLNGVIQLILLVPAVIDLSLVSWKISRAEISAG